MTKRILSGMLGAVLTCSLLLSPAYAAEETEKSDAAVPSAVSWEELESRIRTGNLNSQALEENISSIEVVDYNNLYYSLQKQLNQISAAQSYMTETGNLDGLDSLNQSAAALRSTYEDIRDGKPQRDSEDAVNQLHNAQNQVVTAGQSLYIGILSMEQSLRDGERGITALDRSLTELRLRCSLGQVSEQTVKELERTREDTQSQLDTLRSTISSYKAQLQLLMGETPTGELSLGELPSLSEEEMSSFDEEADMETAKSNSQTLTSAAITAEKAEEERADAEWDYNSGSTKRYQLSSAEHSAEAAKLSYQASVKQFEYSFRELSRSIENCRQVLANKISAAEYQKKQTGIAEKQYELGRISYFSLLSAREKLESAQSEAESAERDLFTAVNKYKNAVAYGIIE